MCFSTPKIPKTEPYVAPVAPPAPEQVAEAPDIQGKIKLAKRGQRTGLRALTLQGEGVGLSVPTQ